MAWSTANECGFIAELGRGTLGLCLFDRARILSQYAEAIERRVNWGTMDPAMVKAFVSRQLQIRAVPCM